MAGDEVDDSVDDIDGIDNVNSSVDNVDGIVHCHKKGHKQWHTFTS